MKRHWIAACAAAMTSVLAPAAWASTSSDISVSDFVVTVKSVVPGSQPGVSFAGAGGSTSVCDSSSGSPRPDQHWSAASGKAFGDASTATTPDPFAGGSATMTGDVFGRGAVASASAFASSLVPASFGDGTIGLVNDVGAALFTLAPGTLLTISATVTATASASGASPDEFAESGLLMSIGDETGLGPQRAYVNFNVYASGLFGQYSDTETTFVTLTYLNDTDATISGLFSGYVSSYASSGDPVSDAPEPGTSAMLLAGLLAVAGVARTRRPAPASPRATRQ
ncbi:MAG TPA: PEP-CTERM sorting domain-containing protein [Burkholderiaceae bacterium]